MLWVILLAGGDSLDVGDNDVARRHIREVTALQLRSVGQEPDGHFGCVQFGCVPGVVVRGIG